MQAQGGDERQKAQTVGSCAGSGPTCGRTAMLWPALVALRRRRLLTLSLPLAVRRVVDNFLRADAARRRLFAAALGIAALLAAGTAARFYLVTWLGERVIADVRRAIDRVVG